MALFIVFTIKPQHNKDWTVSLDSEVKEPLIRLHIMHLVQLFREKKSLSTERMDGGRNKKEIKMKG